MQFVKVPLTPAQVSMFEIEVEDVAHDEERDAWWPILCERRTAMLVSVDHITETIGLLDLGEEYDRQVVALVAKLQKLRAAQKKV
jgi:hypothetical protein